MKRKRRYGKKAQKQKQHVLKTSLDSGIDRRRGGGRGPGAGGPGGAQSVELRPGAGGRRPAG
jgi:hypothetical protein